MNKLLLLSLFTILATGSISTVFANTLNLDIDHDVYPDHSISIIIDNYQISDPTLTFTFTNPSGANIQLEPYHHPFDLGSDVEFLFFIPANGEIGTWTVTVTAPNGDSGTGTFEVIRHVTLSILSTDIDALKHRVVSLEAEVSHHKSLINTLQSFTNTLQSEINSLQSTVEHILGIVNEQHGPCRVSTICE